jgi:hypothetical protein
MLHASDFRQNFSDFQICDPTSARQKQHHFRVSRLVWQSALGGAHLGSSNPIRGALARQTDRPRRRSLIEARRALCYTFFRREEL